MPVSTLDYAPREEFDTGRFVARYLQALAWLSIASMIASPVFFGWLHIDVSFIFLFWAASALKRKSRTARKWTIVVSGIVLGIQGMAFLWATFSGTLGMTLKMGPTRIDNPTLWQLGLAVTLFGAIAGVPFFVLMSERSQRQFRPIPLPKFDAAEAADRLSEIKD